MLFFKFLLSFSKRKPVKKKTKKKKEKTFIKFSRVKFLSFIIFRFFLSLYGCFLNIINLNLSAFVWLKYFPSSSRKENDLHKFLFFTVKLIDNEFFFFFSFFLYKFLIIIEEKFVFIYFFIFIIFFSFFSVNLELNCEE